MRFFKKKIVLKKDKSEQIEPVIPTLFSMGRNDAKKIDWTPYRDIKEKSVKIKISEPLLQQIEEYSDEYANSLSSIIRKSLFITVHGRYRYDQMSLAEDGLFYKESDSGIRFSFEPSVKEEDDTYDIPKPQKALQLGKNKEDLRVWMPEQLYDELKQIVDRKKLTLSSYCRHALTLYFMGELQFK